MEMTDVAAPPQRHEALQLAEVSAADVVIGIPTYNHEESICQTLQAVQAGWQLPHAWSGYSQHAVDTLPLPTRHVPAGDVLRFRDEAFHRYFENPRYLDLVRTTFGETTVAHILQMTSHRLERKYASSSTSSASNANTSPQDV